MNTRINNLVSQIIPESNFKEDVYINTSLIDSLSDIDKKLVETELIQMLSQSGGNYLITEGLVYLKSHQSLPKLYELLSEINDPLVKLRISTSIYQINSDIAMIDIAIDSFKHIDRLSDAYREFRLSPCFFYLNKINSNKTTDLIKNYVDDPNYLISHNAKEALKSIK